MSQESRQEVLAKVRRSYVKAGPRYKAKLLHQVIELFGYHRKTAIRALGGKRLAKAGSAPAIVGHPREYDPQALLPVIKPIWFAAFQPCGTRVHALLPEWLLPMSRITKGSATMCARREEKSSVQRQWKV